MKKIILTASFSIICLGVSVWAKDKTNPIKSEPTPIKIENAIQNQKATPTTFEITWSSFNGGAELNATSTKYKMKSSTAQSVIGESESPNYNMGVGSSYSPGVFCAATAGDANGNGAVNLTDIIFMVNHVFKGGPKPNPGCRGDANGSGGNPNLTDIIYLVNYVFKGGPAPKKSDACCL